MLGAMEWKHAKGDPQLIRSLNGAPSLIAQVR